MDWNVYLYKRFLFFIDIKQDLDPLQRELEEQRKGKYGYL